MKCSKNARKRWLCCAALIVIFLLCSWLFGWFAGSINVIDFEADNVEHLRLSCALFGYEAVTITQKDDIQTVIEKVNSFNHSGKEIKNVLKYGIGAGGSVLYNFDFYLENGERFCVVLSSNDGEQSLSNAEVSYWISQPKSTKMFTDTCRGSLDFFFELYQKYTLGK